jgi:hypothetical protein
MEGAGMNLRTAHLPAEEPEMSLGKLVVVAWDCDERLLADNEQRRS